MEQKSLGQYKGLFGAKLLLELLRVKKNYCFIYGEGQTGAGPHPPPPQKNTIKEYFTHILLGLNTNLEYSFKNDLLSFTHAQRFLNCHLIFSLNALKVVNYNQRY